MNAKEARRLGVGDCIVYGDALHGIIIQIKFEAVRVQWRDSVAMDIPFDAQVLERIHKKVKVKRNGNI